MSTSRIYIRDSTAVPPYALLLFGGALTSDHAEHEVAVDRWIRFDAPSRVGVLVRELRKLLDELLRRKIEDPLLDINRSPIIDALESLLMSRGM